MNQVNNKTIIFMLLFSMIIIVAGTIINIDKMGNLGRITGAATSGNTTLIIDAISGISVTDATASFGTGHVNISADYALISTVGSNDNNWTVTVAPTDNYMTVENTGNTNINLTIKSENVPDAKTWLCGGDCGVGEAGLTITSSDNEAGSCDGGVGLSTNPLASNAVLLNTSANYTVSLCDALKFGPSTDTLNITFYAKVPFQATTGTKTVGVIFSASS